MKFKKNTIFFLIKLLILIIIIFNYVFNIIKEKEIQIENQKKIINQNLIAYQDSLNMKQKQIQEYSVFIKNLSNERDKYKNILIKNKFKLNLDTIINVINKPTSIKDTLKNIIISFEGKDGRIYYKGNVIYFTLEKRAIHNLIIKQDDIKIESIIFLDEKDNLIKNKIYADGVLIGNAYTVVDSLLYIKLFNNNKNSNINKNNIFAIAEIEQNLIKKENLWKTDLFKFNFGLGYKFNNNFYFEIKKDILNNSWKGSIKSTLSIFSF